MVDLDYGASNKFDFDNPQKWITVSSVPLLDVHELTNDAGRPIATVDRSALEEIARNGNRKIHETGDPSTLILGHTSDDPRAPEKPARGFVTNLRVKPFKRGDDGRVIYALHGDYKIRPKNAHLIEEYPRRSVELWWSRKDVDPIAMLGGSAPERDLGAVIRNGRLNHVCLGSSRTGNRDAPTNDDPDVIKFHRRGDYVIENYALPTRGTAMPAPSRNGRGNPTNKYNCGPKGKMNYADDELPLGTHDPGDEGIPSDDGADDWHGTPSADVDDGGGDDQNTSMSPAVQELLQSKQFRDITSKIDQLFTMLTGGGGGEPGAGPPGGVGGDDSMPEMPAPGADGAGMDPMGAGAPGGGMGGPPPGPGPSEEDSRRGMGQRPVQMSADTTGFPGQSNTQVPDFAGRGGKVPSRMSRGTNMNGQRQAGRTNDPRTAALEREVNDLRRYQRESKLRYSQSEASRRVEALVNEGYLFGHTPTLHAEGVEETKRHFAGLLFNAPSEQEGEQDVSYEENIIRTRYSRRRADPVRASQAGLSRYARDPNPPTGGQAPAANDPENFEPVTDEETCEYAELVGARKMSRREAGQVMMQRRERR